MGGPDFEARKEKFGSIKIGESIFIDEQCYAFNGLDDNERPRFLNVTDMDGVPETFSIRDIEEGQIKFRTYKEYLAGEDQEYTKRVMSGEERGDDFEARRKKYGSWRAGDALMIDGINYEFSWVADDMSSIQVLAPWGSGDDDDNAVTFWIDDIESGKVSCIRAADGEEAYNKEYTKQHAALQEAHAKQIQKYNTWQKEEELTINGRAYTFMGLDHAKDPTEIYVWDKEDGEVRTFSIEAIEKGLISCIRAIDPGQGQEQEARRLEKIKKLTVWFKNLVKQSPRERGRLLIREQGKKDFREVRLKEVFDEGEYSGERSEIEII